MSKPDALLVLRDEEQRQKACRWVHSLPAGTRLGFFKPKRTLPQNDRMWAMLTVISEQLTFHGDHLTPDQWKQVFVQALHHGQPRAYPGLEGGVVLIDAYSSSALSKSEFSDLFELISAYAAQHGITAWPWEGEEND